MDTIFHRPELATALAERLLRPGPLDTALRSGLFVRGMRRTGKTTFVVHDLIPSLESLGAVTVYVDLWTAPARSPAEVVHEAVRGAVVELANPASRALARLSALKGVQAEAFGTSFGLAVERLGEPDGPTLAETLVRLVDRATSDVVLIVDEVQHALGTEAGRQLMFALKAARDAVNIRTDSPGHLLFVGTGSHRSLVGELTEQRSQAFAGAYSMEFPSLGRDYVEDLLARIREHADASGHPARLPSVDAAVAAFETVGHRPEDLLRALEILGSSAGGIDDPDVLLAPIAATLREGAADVELAKVERLGAVAVATFARLVEGESADAEGERGLFSAATLGALSRRLGRAVTSDEVNAALRALVAENLVMRVGRGRYGVTDPFVRTLARERRATRRALGLDAGDGAGPAG